MANGPAAKAGLKKGDRLVAFEGNKITHTGEVGSLAQSKAGKAVSLAIERNGQQQNLQPVLNKENKGNGYLGVGTIQSGIQLQKSTWSAPVVAVGLTKQLTEITFKGLGTAISSLSKGDRKTASEQVSGPVGIAVILNEGSKIGINFTFIHHRYIVAVAGNYECAADSGAGRAADCFILLLFRALKKPLSKELEERITAVGFTALMGLFVLITYVDIKRFF